jgi:PmbA protein
MHTQDSSSGRFSVSAPKTLVIEDGVVKGKVKATIAGNFFEVLNDHATDFGWIEEEDVPAIALTCQVTIEESN